MLLLVGLVRTSSVFSSPFRIDPMAVKMGLENSRKWAEAPSRKLARDWAPSDAPVNGMQLTIPRSRRRYLAEHLKAASAGSSSSSAQRGFPPWSRKGTCRLKISALNSRIVQCRDLIAADYAMLLEGAPAVDQNLDVDICRRRR